MGRVVARVLLLVLLGAASNGGASGTAYAHDDDADREGTCTGGISWRMRAKADDGRIEIEAEIDTDRADRRWTWVLRHNGSVSDRGAARTSGSAGSFEVERTAIDVHGSDTFRFRASHRAVACVARVVL